MNKIVLTIGIIFALFASYFFGAINSQNDMLSNSLGKKRCLVYANKDLAIGVVLSSVDTYTLDVYAKFDHENSLKCQKLDKHVVIAPIYKGEIIHEKRLK